MLRVYEMAVDRIEVAVSAPCDYMLLDRSPRIEVPNDLSSYLSFPDKFGSFQFCRRQGMLNDDTYKWH